MSVTTASAAPLPTNGKYVSGSGAIRNSAGGMTIDQSGSSGIVDWQSVSIGQGKTVQFDNGSGATLNEVTGNNLSQIAGSLTTTGSACLVNPSGILVTPTGKVITSPSA
ncbi:MAG TPA: filamentous hemagglutinin N-terminal domain-containing protein [Rhizomicrobium sp.]|jgi:filamentous hemagglutinin family protein|nr:filamentous hemagglutinin N-terminal domain-containing protein [Rhizomicrobium sp.]